MNLSGEVISRQGARALVQVYEPTESLRPGEPVTALGHPLSVELGPGLLGGIFDGVQRPLLEFARQRGDFVPRGVHIPPLDRSRLWRFEPAPDLAAGAAIRSGAVLGSVQETQAVVHRILAPPGVDGRLLDVIPASEITVDGVVARVESEQGTVHELKLFHRWPVRTPRPYSDATKAWRRCSPGSGSSTPSSRW